MEIHYLDHRKLKNQVELQEKVIKEQEKKINENKSELKELYKAIADAKSVIELQS
jgi:peptidoglycan hydrolase CwlO-like protein